MAGRPSSFSDRTDQGPLHLCVSQDAAHNWLSSAVADFPLELSVLGSLINSHLRNHREAFNMHQMPSLSRESRSPSKLTAVCVLPCPHSLTQGNGTWVGKGWISMCDSEAVVCSCRVGGARRMHHALISLSLSLFLFGFSR